MSRVEINADGRHVVVDHVGDLPYLMEKALDTWRATEKVRPTRGFVQGTQPRYEKCACPGDCVPHGSAEAPLVHAPGCICTLYIAPGWENRVHDRDAACPVHGTPRLPGRPVVMGEM